MFNLKRGITMMPGDSHEMKVTKRHTRSLSQDKLAGESEADINYESIVKAKRVADVHEPILN
jgi:hypothetical protein